MKLKLAALAIAVLASGGAFAQAPAGTPKAVITKMNLGIRVALKSEDVRNRFAAGGLEPTPSTPEEFDRYLRAEIAKWAKVIKEAKLEAN